MSNCIHIHNPKIRLTADQVDLEKLDDLLHRTVGITRDNAFNWPDKEAMMAWWYLEQNTTITRSTHKLYEYTDIELGMGRSTHTWRDFRGTMSILAKMLHKPLIFILRLSDESDSFEAKYRATVKLSPDGSVEIK